MIRKYPFLIFIPIFLGVAVTVLGVLVLMFFKIDGSDLGKVAIVIVVGACATIIGILLFFYRKIMVKQHEAAKEYEELRKREAEKQYELMKQVEQVLKGEK